MAYKRPRALSPSASHKRYRGPAGHVVLGTALPVEDGDDGAFVPIWKQNATDEHGRRVLPAGAFTGSFRVGYNNTAGSKEGFEVKSFFSSRTNRAKDQDNGRDQRIEDFMDAEDLAEAAESRHLETSQNFAGIGGAGKASAGEGLFGLFLSQEETMGVKIAQKMGWRRDQGIGRKVCRSARLEDSTIEESAAHLFAPEDTKAMPLSRQDVKRKGLGYQSEARLGEAIDKSAGESAVPDLHFLEISKGPAATKKNYGKKSSIGVGVLNDTGSDDEDPYELGPKITFNKTLGTDKKIKKPSKFAKAGGASTPVFIPRKKKISQSLVSFTRKSMDGKPPLPGFVLASESAELKARPRYPPPKVPDDWVSSRGHALPNKASEYQSAADAAKSSELDAKKRSTLLGEKPLPGKSVFDFISKDARDRLAKLSGKSDLPQGLGEGAPQGYLPAAGADPKDLWDVIPKLDKAVAAGALAKGATGWMPYAEDAQKQRRYRRFLELRAGLQADLPERSSAVSISDWIKELQEFAHAANVFKPTAGIMASRFTSSSASTLPGSSTDTQEEDLLKKPVTEPEDPAVQAAKLGMYGAMTRSSFPFYPSRLLCKRFNVRAPPDMPPEAESNEEGFRPQTEEVISKTSMEKMRHEVLTSGTALQRPAWMEQISEAPRAEVTQQPVHAVVNIEKNESLLSERAPEDVFKAVFGDSDDDD